jgi:ABC-type phosphate transport system ATPase subunit
VLSPDTYSLVSCPSTTSTSIANDDYYRLELTDDEQVDLTLDGDGATDLDLFLYDSMGISVAYSVSTTSHEVIHDLEAKQNFGVTSVVISHDIASALKVADEVAFLYDGELVEDTTPALLRKSQHPFVKKFLATWFER